MPDRLKRFRPARQPVNVCHGVNRFGHAAFEIGACFMPLLTILCLLAGTANAETALFNLTPPDAGPGDPSIIAAAYHHVILGPAVETVPPAVEALLTACDLT